MDKYGNTTTQELVMERNKLRELYKLATPSMRKVIVMRGKLISWAIEARRHTTDHGTKEVVKALEEVFGV